MTEDTAASEIPAAYVEATDGLMRASIALIELGAAASELLSCLNLAIDLSVMPPGADRDCDLYAQLVDAWTRAAVIKQQRFISSKCVVSGDEPRLDLFLIQMGCRAMSIILELRVALPYRSTVFAGGVPYLGTEVGAAVTANDPRSKNAVPAVTVSDRLAPCKLGLHQLELHGVNNRLMAFFYIILRNLALIGLHLFQQKVDRELLL